MTMMNVALKVAQRLKIQNRKLVVAWVAMLAAVVASFTLGYNWKDAASPLVLDGATCTWVPTGKVYVCQQGEKEFLVVPMTDR